MSNLQYVLHRAATRSPEPRPVLAHTDEGTTKTKMLCVLGQLLNLAGLQEMSGAVYAPEENVPRQLAEVVVRPCKNMSKSSKPEFITSS